MVIGYFSPARGQAGTTGNLLSIAIMEAICHKKKVMVMESFFGKSDIERYLLKMPKQYGKGDVFGEYGIDTVIRNGKLSGLEETRFLEGSYSFLEGRLLILPGSRQRESEIFEKQMDANFLNVLNLADTIVDYVFVDTKDAAEKIGKEVLKRADCIAVNLPQSPAVLEEYFENMGVQKKDRIYLLGKYDGKSQYNKRNLFYLFPEMEKKNTVAIPYSTEIKDALEAAEILKFYRKFAVCDRKCKNYQYVQSIKEVEKRIRKSMGEKVG